jgi:Ca-activated chloride channel family protein
MEGVDRRAMNDALGNAAADSARAERIIERETAKGPSITAGQSISPDSTENLLTYTDPSDAKLADVGIGAHEPAATELRRRKGQRDGRFYGDGAGGLGGRVEPRAWPAEEDVAIGNQHHRAFGEPRLPGMESTVFGDLFDDEGKGPGEGGNKYEPITENSFENASDTPLSTFSIDVDTASYSKMRMYLTQNNMLPRRDSVRIEELVNYFSYDYAGPDDKTPFAAHIEVAECPWKPGNRLVRIGIQGRELAEEKRPTSNLVFLLDVSGSMQPANKLPLLKRGMSLLVDQLGENDRVAIVVYAGAAGLVLDSTTGNEKAKLRESLDRLHAGGSTNGGDGIRLAYQTALDNFIAGGVNRVILCTDGDFNVGTTGTDELVQMAETNAKANVFLSVLGFGMGNHNDSMLEQVSNRGNGNYAYIDSDSEARKVLAEQLQGTLVTIAKDVKIQVDFNSQEVAKYRLIGYENRMLAAKDFNDDKKDAGEIGAGHTVTALYEIVPAGVESDIEVPSIDESKYQSKTNLKDAAGSGELLTLRLRYKRPEGDTSSLVSFPVTDEGKGFTETPKDFRFTAAVASFGMLLRDSHYKGNTTYDGVLEIAQESVGDDEFGYRREFLELVRKAKNLAGQ